jgi:hypothetical protein
LQYKSPEKAELPSNLQQMELQYRLPKSAVQPYNRLMSALLYKQTGKAALLNNLQPKGQWCKRQVLAEQLNTLELSALQYMRTM